MASSSHHIGYGMLGQNPSQPAIFQMVDIDSLIPETHRLRQIDAALDLSFVREAVATCYTPKRGRPSIDPELAVRMMILGVLYNLSDRQLCDEIRMHAGFRWFCRLNFHDSVPDHSTLSRLRNERWAKSELFTRLFEEVLRRCAQAGMISGRHVSIDGTQVKANASMQSLESRAKAKDEEEGSPGSDEPSGDDQPKEPPAPHLNLAKPAPAAKQKTSAAFKDPLPQGAWQARGEGYSNETHVSRTDTEARLYKKGGAGARLSYLVHDVIDTKSRVILGRRASLATGRAEREVALELLDEHEERRRGLAIEQAVEVLSADGGYGTGEFVADVIDRGIMPHVPLQADDELEEIPSWQRPTYDLERYRKRRESLRQALARNTVRFAYRKPAYSISRKLRIRSEHIFAEAKNEHGLDQAHYRGLERMDRQSLLTATVQNLKRLARTLRRQANAASADFGYLCHVLQDLLSAFTANMNHGGNRGHDRLWKRVWRQRQLPIIPPAQKPISSTAF